MKNRYTKKLVSIILLILITVNVYAQIDHSFTYQGELIDSGSPADGLYDITIQAFDAASTGNAIGSISIHDSVQVNDGVFTVNQVNLGNVIFDGMDAWLEIQVKKPADANYTALTPLQKMQSVPYANTLIDNGAVDGQVLTFDSAMGWQPVTPLTDNDNQDLTLMDNTLNITDGTSATFTGWDTNAADDFSGDYNDLNNLPVIASGLKKVGERVNPFAPYIFGWRLIGSDPNNHGNIGLNAVDLSTYDFPSSTTGATGEFSFATGFATTTSGIRSTAMGGGTIASGHTSTAMGNGTNALGRFSTSMGTSTTALGSYSTAMGVATRAEARASLAIGQYNVGGGNPTSFISTNPVFEVGNGNGNPSNSLTVYAGTDASFSDSSGFVMIGNDYGVNLVFDNNEIMARNNGGVSTLFLQQDGGTVAVNGSVVHSSDKRLKEDIENLPYGLAEIMVLEPKAYNWKNRTQKHKSFGLIAQDVREIMKELVHESNVDDNKNKDKMLSLSYTELIPVLVNAIKQQQKLIDSQNQENIKIKEMNLNLSKRMDDIELLLLDHGQ